MQRKDNKGQDMKEELIKHVMEEADKCYQDDFPIPKIEFWIREFFDQYQPERSKREDPIVNEAKREFRQFLDETFDRRMEIVEQLQKERDAVL
jgi:hypothetical protein